jgi:hypothetical protein
LRQLRSLYEHYTAGGYTSVDVSFLISYEKHEKPANL